MIREKGVKEYGDGVVWFRGTLLGKGAFGSVYLATLKNPRSKYSYFPSMMVVKSAEVSASGSIQKEREVLSNIEGCSDIIQCFGEEITMGEDGAMVYNLLLEYGSGGTLADKIKKTGGGGLPEIETKVYARSILRGLNHIHELGYVHCDLKPDNILLVPNKRGETEFRAKIGDFGLTKREKQSRKRKLEPYWRGTPMYLSPEAVTDSVQDAPSDIWAFGCIVLEMLSGKPPWDTAKELSAGKILNRIGTGGELPIVPKEISKEARDFLKCCFVRKSVYRFTAEMLLNHKFLEGLHDDYADEEIEEVEDLNEVDCISLASASNDEFGSSLCSDGWSAGSEDGLISYLSEEDLDNALPNLAEEGKLEVDEDIERINGTPSIDTGFAQLNASNIPSKVSPKSRRDFPVSFIIPAGV